MDAAVDKDVELAAEGVGKGAKYGLALIAILAIIFVGLLIMKLSSSGDETAASDIKKPKTANAAGTGSGWSKSAPPSTSFDSPIVVSPMKETAKRTHRHHSGAWATGSTTPSSGSPGTASTGGMTILPAPSPSNQYGTTNQPTGTAQSGQPYTPPDPFVQAPVTVPNAPAYGSQSNYPTGYPTPSEQPQNHTTYAPYPQTNPPSADAPASNDPNNPLRGSDSASNSNHHQYPSAGYSNSYGGSSNSYGTSNNNGSSNSYGSSNNYGSSNGYNHDNNQYGSSADSRSNRDDGYQQVPYSRKKANRYTYPEDDGSSRSGRHHRRRSSHDDPFSNLMSGKSKLGGLRDDGKYVVGPNENFSTISESLYGTSAYFRALAEFNRSKYPDENRLLVGDVIEAPEESELLSKYPDLCPSPERSKIMRSRISTVSMDSHYGSSASYTVQAGDTLFDIARYKLGNGARWPEIYDLNFKMLQGDFNYLTPGMKLFLPEEPVDSVTKRPSLRTTR